MILLFVSVLLVRQLCLVSDQSLLIITGQLPHRRRKIALARGRPVDDDVRDNLCSRLVSAISRNERIATGPLLM